MTPAPTAPTAAAPSFPSTIDAWLVAVVVAAFVATVYPLVELSHESTAALAVAICATLALPLVLWLVVLPCRYVLTDDHLLICFGRFRRRIPYRDITAVARSRSPVSAPALSLRRVKVSTGRQGCLVSPSDRERFIDLLQQRVDAARASSTLQPGGPGHDLHGDPR